MTTNTHRQGVIKRDQVRLDDQDLVAPRRASGTSGGGSSRPRVRLVQLGEGAQAVEFTCSCGEVSLIEITSDKQ
jgi:hypothetical protein